MKIGVTVSKDASEDLIHKAKAAAREDFWNLHENAQFTGHVILCISFIWARPNCALRR